MIIRAAEERDLEGIWKLYEILFSEMAAFQPYYFQNSAQDTEFLKRVIGGEKSDVIIAAEGDTVCALALVTEERTPDYGCLVPHRYAHLVDIVTDPGYRGKKIGRALLDNVKKWARDRGLAYIELDALSDNSRAIKMYEREGFQEKMRTFRCVLEEK